MPWHQIRTECAALRHLQTGSCPQQRSSCQSTLLQTHRSFSYTLALTSRQIDGRDTHPVRRCREERVFRMTDLFEIQGGIVKGNELHFWQLRTVETTIVCFCVEMLLWICVTLAGQSQLWIQVWCSQFSVSRFFFCPHRFVLHSILNLQCLLILI